MKKGEPVGQEHRQLARAVLPSTIFVVFDLGEVGRFVGLIFGLRQRGLQLLD